MRKENLKAKICSLCFNTKFDVYFKVVVVIKEVLEVVLPKLNLEEGEERVICNSCSVKLFAAFNFKSICTDTEDTIFPYVTSQEVPLVDLREIYLREKGDIQLSNILRDQKICRLCFQSVGLGFVSLNEVDANIIDNYIPEVNFNATKDPVVCISCSDSLVTHGTFLGSCLTAQEENRKICGNPVEDRECRIKTEQIKTEDDWDRKVCGDPAEARECCIKTEEIKIEDDCDSYPPTSLENVEAIKNLDGRFSSENKPVGYKNHLLRKVRTYTCNRCDFKTVHKGSLKRHCLNHISLTPTYISKRRDASSPCPLSDQARMFQCENCPYKTYVRQVFLNHCWTHKLPSKTKVYQCEKCHYRVTREHHFRRHQLRHEDSTETIGNFKSRLSAENVPAKKNKVTYSCDRCDFKTVYSWSLKKHCLTHIPLTPTYVALKSQCKSESGDPLTPSPLTRQEQMYQCEKCPYRTHLRNKFARHCSTHEMPSDVKVYQCEICHYRVTQKEYLRLHLLRHENSAVKHPPKNVRTYTCDKCEFKTVYKKNLTRHCLTHKTNVWKDVKCYTTVDGELIYKCNVCKSEARDKSQLLGHQCRQLKFKCHVCAYQTARKSSLTTHQLKHNSEAKMYKCDVCPYQTIWKHSLGSHQLRHKSIDEVKTYDCDKCSYKSKHKKCLKNHMLLHGVLE